MFWYNWGPPFRYVNWPPGSIIPRHFDVKSWFCFVKLLRQKVDNCWWQLLLTRPQSYLPPFTHCTVLVLTHNNFTIFFMCSKFKFSQSKFRQNMMLKIFWRKTQKLFLWNIKFRIKYCAKQVYTIVHKSSCRHLFKSKPTHSHT